MRDSLETKRRKESTSETAAMVVSMFLGLAGAFLLLAVLVVILENDFTQEAWMRLIVAVMQIAGFGGFVFLSFGVPFAFIQPVFLEELDRPSDFKEYLNEISGPICIYLFSGGPLLLISYLLSLV